jgi:antitoxin component of MazEF toxin-antitoxin module
MVRKIEIVGEVIKIGNSKGIIIGKNIIKYLELNVGDWIKGTIEKVIDEERPEKEK